MDKFTKTTEVDISNMGLIEEDTPQKSKAGKIIAIVISLLLSISIWLYVVETDKTEVEEVYENIVVHVLNEPDGYKVKAENVTVILTGTNSKLVDIDEADIIVEIKADNLTEEDTIVTEYKAYINGEVEPSVEVKVKSNKIKVKVAKE